ncbi:MAG: 30S ribosomal protein S16 [Rhodothermales bacterium]
MAVKLRLRRMGRKKRPVYALVAADTRSPRDGRYIEDLGRYYAVEEPARIVLQEDRILYWLQQGAQPSDTVRSMLKDRGLMLALHLHRKGKSEEEIQTEVASFLENRTDRKPQKSTLADRRRELLLAEAATAQKAEAEEAKLMAEAEAKAKADAEAAKLKAAEERVKEQETAAEAALDEQADANKAQAKEDAAAPVADEAPAAETATAAEEALDAQAEANKAQAKEDAEAPAAEEAPAADAPAEETPAADAEKKEDA